MKCNNCVSKGIFCNNPVFILALGLCPALAVTTSVENAIGMGISATFVLFFSNSLISLFRNQIPEKIRIPCYIVIIATFVTIVSMILEAYFPKIFESLGIYVPLIVVNCIVLGRAEAFARHHSIKSSILDALGMGIGFTLALILIGGIRELLGKGTITLFESTILSLPIKQGMLIMIFPPGALLTIGLLIALFTFFSKRKKHDTKESKA